MKKLCILLLMLPLVATTTFADKTINHRIQKGDTLTKIAKKNHTSIQTLRKINGLRKGTVLQIGKVLQVPANDQKTKVVKSTAKSKTSKHASRIKSNKKLASSLSRLKTVKLDKENTLAKKSDRITLNDIFFTRGNKKSKVRSEKIIKLAKKNLGKKYVWGATGRKNTFDCSGLTQYVCKKNGIEIPRTSIKQSKYGKFVPRSDLKKGDLIFFDTSRRRKGYVNHVGIYIGDNKFIHASSAKKKVVITSLDRPFYSQRYKGARRVISL